MNNQPPGSNVHKDDLFLPYLEGRLTSEQREELEDHLRGCPTCSAELEELREIVSALREHREVFCPDLSQLYELVHHGADVDGSIAAHVTECPSCREACDLLREGGKEDLSDAAASALAARASSGTLEPLATRTHRPGVMLHSLKRFRIPAVAASLAAAVFVAAVLLFPWKMPEYAVVVSSVSWEQVPRPKEVGGTRPRSATVIVLKGFHEPLKQARVDKLYQAAAPTMEVYERYRVLSPETVKQEWDREPPSSEDRQSLLRWLNRRLDVSRAVIVTVSPSQSGLSLDAELVDTASGAVLDKIQVRDIPEARLEDNIRRLVLRLFLSAAPSS